MFISHFGVGFAAKKFAPALSLGYLFIAAQFLDLLWPTLLLFDLEHVRIDPGNTAVTPLDFYDYPITHSLLMVVGWGVLFGGLVWLIMRKWVYGFVVFICVVSHWFLDLIVHRPDLPLSPGSEVVGLGLWNYPIVAFVVELAFFGVCVYVYYQQTQAKDKTGKYLLAFLIGFLLLIQVGNYVGPAPEDVASIAWAGHLQWIFVILAFVVDRHRTAKAAKLGD